MAEELKELFCSRDLALWLGALQPQTPEQHLEMKRAGCMLLRVPTGQALFWPMVRDGAKTKPVR